MMEKKAEEKKNKAKGEEKVITVHIIFFNEDAQKCSFVVEDDRKFSGDETLIVWRCW